MSDVGKLFEIRDRVTIADAWLLSFPVENRNWETRRRIAEGLPYDNCASLGVFSACGKHPMDWMPVRPTRIPAVSVRLATLLESVVPDDVRLVDTKVNDEYPIRLVGIVNSNVDCLDKEEMDRQSWATGDFPVPIIRTKLVPNARIFRLVNGPIIASDNLIIELRLFNPTGMVFIERRTTPR